MGPSFEHVPRGQAREVEGLQKPQRMYILNEPQLRCPFKDAGYGMTLKLGNKEQHNKQCEFNPGNLKECEGGCGAIMTETQFRSHSCVEHLKILLEEKEKQY